MTVNGAAEPVRLPADAMRAISARLMPILWEHGSATLVFGRPDAVITEAGGMVTSAPLALERPRDIVPGAGRRGASRALDSVVSVRFDSPLLASVRELAAEDGQSLSDWVRNAVWRERARRAADFYEDDESVGEVLAAYERGIKGVTARPQAALGNRTAGWGRTFSCQHLSIGGVASASCGICGPLAAAA